MRVIAPSLETLAGNLFSWSVALRDYHASGDGEGCVRSEISDHYGFIIVAGQALLLGCGLLVWEHTTQHGTEEAILMPNTVQPFHPICGLLEFYFGDRNTTFSGH